MKRAKLEREKETLASVIDAIRARFGARSKEYIAALERLKALRIEGFKRDLNWRKRNHKRAA